VAANDNDNATRNLEIQLLFSSCSGEVISLRSNIENGD
jgi:hypothetical protein